MLRTLREDLSFVLKEKVMLDEDSLRKPLDTLNKSFKEKVNLSEITTIFKGTSSMT